MTKFFGNRYHSKENKFRTFLFALLFWSLTWGAIFAVWWQLGYFG
jgi:hypothetical protein